MTKSETPRWLNILYAVPIIGWIVRDLLEGDDHQIWYFLAGAVSLWGIAILIWGLPGLLLPALAMVPVVFIILLLITRG